MSAGRDGGFKRDAGSAFDIRGVETGQGTRTGWAGRLPSGTRPGEGTKFRTV